MKKLKKFAALGLSITMVSAMAVGVQAAELDQQVNNRADGNTSGVSADASVDVDGYLTKDAIVDSKGNLTSAPLPPYTVTESSVYIPTLDSSSNSTLLPTFTSGNTPVDSNGSHASWGDPATKNTTQLIITAPTKLAFQVAGEGDKANIMLASEGKNITGTILNQSCYVDEDLYVAPKAVDVQAARNTPDNAAFELVSTTGSFNDNTTGVKGVYLSLGDKKTEFLKMDTPQNIGELPKGTKARTNEGKEAVNGSSTKISFSDVDGGATGVVTHFAPDYDGTNLKTSYNVQMTFTVK